MLIHLIREHNPQPTDNVILGELYIDGIKICDTLENRKCAIPALTYRVQVTHSPKFGRLLPEICQVPNRSGIRIHAGNTDRDSSGCVLVGEKLFTLDGQRQLTHSKYHETKLTSILLAAQNDREEIRIEVTEEQPSLPGYPHICSAID